MERKKESFSCRRKVELIGIFTAESTLMDTVLKVKVMYADGFHGYTSSVSCCGADMDSSSDGRCSYVVATER